MQNIRLIESSGGDGRRLFAGKDIGLKQHHHDLRCPRCDSLNTKFCYYNNYNLSQPRHFCKSCRRYWTKGGVLRNVPVGGGVRKSKSKCSGKPKSTAYIPPSATVSVERTSSISENSSSGSSRTTENTTVTNSTPAKLLNFNKPSTRFFDSTQSYTPITTFDSQILNQASARNISLEIGTFTNMTNSSTDRLPLPPEINTSAGIPSFQLDQQNPLQLTDADVKMQEMRSSTLMEQTAEIDYTGLGSTGSNGGVAGKDDWQNTGSVDDGLFDLTGTVDQAYWSQSQWNDDHHRNFLP